MFRVFLLLASAISLGACASDLSGSPAPGFGPVAVQESSDPLTITYSIPNEGGEAPNGVQFWSLVGQRLTEDRQFGVSVLWSTLYGARNWKYYLEARGPNGDLLELESIEREVERCSESGCVFYEAVAIGFNGEMLATGIARQLIVRISARDGSEVALTIPSAAIRELLSEMGVTIALGQ